MTRPDCQHARGNDPRRGNRCVKCGAEMPEIPTRERDLNMERHVVEHACAGLWCDPAPLIDHMQRRAALNGPRVRVGVDWLSERLEELADDTNYAVWDLVERLDDDTDRAELLASMAEVASAYERIRLVRERRREVREP